MRFGTVILAGGEGRRIGGDKPLIRLADQTLLERAIALARTWPGDMAVSLRQPGQFSLPDGVPPILDEDGEGPLAGLHSALRFARDHELAAVLTMPCDVPLAPDDLAERLSHALNANVGAALAMSGGVLHPACTLWRTTALDALPSYRATGKSSLRGFAAFVGFATAEWPCEPFDPFFNVNSREDLVAAETLLRNR